MSNRVMKDSGIEWVGEIPSGWDNVKISSIYRESSIKVSDVDYPPLSVTKKGVLPQLENVAKTKNGDNRKLVEVGDFVINSRSDRKGSSGLSAFTGSVSVINTVLKPTTNTDNLYYHFLFKSNLFTEEFYKWGTGIVEDLWSTKWSKMKKINIPLPHLHEQQAIATYLDEQVSRLDQLIEDQQQVIEDWKAYKQSLITETVTKGLNPEVEMKDSGIEWIGEIPSHWDNVKIGSVYRESSIKVSDIDYPPLSVTKKGVLPQLENVAKTKNGDNRKLVEVGDFVINSRSDRKGSSGVSVFTGSVSVINTVLKPTTNTDNLYYHFLFKCNLFTEEFYKWGTGIVEDLWSTKWSKMKKINVPIPPLHEQQQIAEFLDKKCSKIDQLIEDKQRLIEDLKDYKQSLIYECVTGKKEIV